MLYVRVCVRVMVCVKVFKRTKNGKTFFRVKTWPRVAVVGEGRRSSSCDRQRRVGLRQVDGIALGRRSTRTGAGGQAALDAVEEELVFVVVVVVIIASAVVVVPSEDLELRRGGHGVGRFLDFVQGRQHRLLLVDQTMALSHQVTASEQFLGGLCKRNKQKKKIISITVLTKSHTHIHTQTISILFRYVP